MATLEIFVSHSHEDDAFCRLLVDALRHAGADVWYDEHNLVSGQLLDVIEHELRARKRVSTRPLAGRASLPIGPRRDPVGIHSSAP